MTGRAITIGLAAALTLTAQAPEGGHVSGRATRSDTGAGLAKATIVLYPQDEQTGNAAHGQLAVQTSADGSFSFTGVPAGSYAVDATRNGFVMESRQSLLVTLGAAQNASGIEVHLAPAAVISGSVTDQDHEAVANVQVTALRLRYITGAAREVTQAAAVTTDDRGEFRFAGLRAGSYYLVAGGSIHYPRITLPLKQSAERTLQYRETYYPEDAVTSEAALPIRVEPGGEAANIQITLRPEATFRIEGKLEARDARVTYQRLGSILTNRGYSAAVRPDGGFEITGLAPGDYLLKAEGLGGSPRYAKVRVEGNTRVEFPAGAESRVRGKADADGANAAGLRVFLGTYPGKEIYLSEIGEDGKFDIRNIAPGEYWFDVRTQRWNEEPVYVKKAQCGGVEYTARRIAINLGTQIANCEVTLGTDSGSVSGRVMDDDKPVADQAVVMLPQSAELRRIPRYTRFAASGADGRFQLRGAIPGDYYVFATTKTADLLYLAPDFVDRHSGGLSSVTVGAGATQVLTLKPLR